MDVEMLARESVDCAFHIHRELGPGLLESVYETVMARAMEKRGFRVERQKPISFSFEDIVFDEAFRPDLLIEGTLLIELKSAERMAPVYSKQVLTYLRLMKLPLGLLINFGAPTFKEGIMRIVNNHKDISSSHLRLHEK